jgi:hypothetical protein
LIVYPRFDTKEKPHPIVERLLFNLAYVSWSVVGPAPIAIATRIKTIHFIRPLSLVRPRLATPPAYHRETLRMRNPRAVMEFRQLVNLVVLHDVGNHER